jgi:hypothetical protein
MSTFLLDADDSALFQLRLRQLRCGQILGSLVSAIQTCAQCSHLQIVLLYTSQVAMMRIVH